MNAKFNMPEFFKAKGFYYFLTQALQKSPEIFYPDTEIACVYGNFPGNIWDGGGINIGGSVPAGAIRDTIDFYNYELHLPLRFTFTNPLLETNHMFDTYANIIAAAGQNGHNEILTSCVIAEQYLRKNYPNYKFCRSIIAAKDKPYDDLNIYDLTVMKRRMNNNWEYLDTIPQKDRNRIEFLCCDPCPDDCPRLYTHYRDFARAQLEYDTENEKSACSMNDVKGEFPHAHMFTLETYISRALIDSEYLPRGFNQFKVSGRGDITGPIAGALMYLIKPEYHIDIIHMFGAGRFN